MVQHNWIESKLIYLERNDKERQQNKQMQQAFINLLRIYHTGRFLTMSEEDIQKELSHHANR